MVLFSKKPLSTCRSIYTYTVFVFEGSVSPDMTENKKQCTAIELTALSWSTNSPFLYLSPVHQMTANHLGGIVSLLKVYFLHLLNQHDRMLCPQTHLLVNPGNNDIVWDFLGILLVSLEHHPQFLPFEVH